MRTEFGRVVLSLVTVAAFAGLSDAAHGQPAGLGGIFNGNFHARSNYTVSVQTDLSITKQDGTQLTLSDGMMAPAGATVSIDFNLVPPSGNKVDARIHGYCAVGNQVLFDSDMGKADVVAGSGQSHLTGHGRTKIVLRVTGETPDRFERSFNVFVFQPVTVKDPGATKVILPTTKPLTVTVTPPVTTLTGGTMTFNPSFGPAPAGTITVPDLKTLTPAAARQALKTAGFTGKIQVDYFKSDLRNPHDGQVFDQSPTPGTHAKKDSAVTLKVYGRP